MRIYFCSVKLQPPHLQLKPILVAFINQTMCSFGLKPLLRCWNNPVAISLPESGFHYLLNPTEDDDWPFMYYNETNIVNIDRQIEKWLSIYGFNISTPLWITYSDKIVFFREFRLVFICLFGFEIRIYFIKKLFPTLI